MRRTLGYVLLALALAIGGVVAVAGALAASSVVASPAAFLSVGLSEEVPPTSRLLPPGATYWDLPTGSKIAVLKVEARSPAPAPPKTPRMLAVMLLREVNPRAAARFAPDAELGPYFDRVANEIYLKATLCPGHETSVRSDGYGFWANQMTGRSLAKHDDDPKPRLRTVATPVLVLRGTCDYKKPEVAREYVEVFPNARLHVLENAGHMPYVEAQENYLREVRRFLQEVMPPGDGDLQGAPKGPAAS